MAKETTDNQPAGGYTRTEAPSITLPKGGGSIRSIDEKFKFNAINGTAGLSIPVPLSPSRNGFAPSLTIGYDSGNGNSPFGLGWSADLPAIARRTDKRLPEYKDGEGSDIFVFAGAEDLVPCDAPSTAPTGSLLPAGSLVTRYRPRIDGAFIRIEKIQEPSGNVYWRVTSTANVVTLFGKSRSAQLADPSDPTRIYQWLLEFSYDDKGNCYQYEYKPEDITGIPGQPHEHNRLNKLAPFANTYLKRIKYGNKTHFDRNSLAAAGTGLSSDAAWTGFLTGIDYLFELVLDYGEHDPADPQPGDDKGWLCRTDAFSQYKAGFEIRTYRLCRRALLFHRFAELGPTPCLISSLDLTYTAGPVFSFLTTATVKGYIRQPDGAYTQKSLPPISLSYEPLGWDTEIRTLPAASLENIPTGIDDRYYQWIDLYNEGVSGILTEQAGAWYYKSNAGDGYFEGLQLVASKPSFTGLSAGTLRFHDLEGRGEQFLVTNDLEGYFELGDDNRWNPFRSLPNRPNIDPADPNLKFLDLNGDGMTDILLTQDEVFTWYESKGKEGFEGYHTLPTFFDEEKGPAIVFADPTESIVLADMSGDGLPDIVRIRFSEIVYWPNLGFGRFGAKVTMSNAPVFDTYEDFNPRYVKLGDIDGSGTTDIVYLGKNTFQVYFNQAGNSWSAVNIIQGVNPLPFPGIDSFSDVRIIDLLGNGTGCIVWSSPLPGDSGRQIQYIDLIHGKKSHLLNNYVNNQGKEVQIAYKSSSFYYLQDKKAGTPWVTKLPFPVYCVDQVTTIDHIRNTRFTNRYSYHHGYYDQPEREFRGFGRIDQTDTEDFDNYQKNATPGGAIQIVDEGFHQPPILTKTWFHTGAFLDNDTILAQFAHEYYQNAVTPEKELPDPLLPPNLTTEEYREAFRACKGIALRAEVYALDGSDRQQHPYSSTHTSCLVQLLQPKGDNPYAVFMVQQSESLAYTYERNPADPRIAHQMTLATDAFGNVLAAASVNYGRKIADPTLTPDEQTRQAQLHIVYTQKKLTNTIDTATDYRLPFTYDSLTYELTGLTPAGGDYFTLTEIGNAFDQAATIPYQAAPTPGKQGRRLLSRSRALMLKNDLSGPLATGLMDPLGFSYQTYKLSLTSDLRDFIFGGKVTDNLLRTEGRYVDLDGDGSYWIPSGTQTFDPAHFYEVTAVTDPLGISTQIVHDPTYHLFVQSTTDALNNQSSIVQFNYRTLRPTLTKDLNDNRAGARADELGMVIATFIMGKDGENAGDLMDTDVSESSPNDQPGSIFEYDLSVYQTTGKPNFTKTTVRETHYFDNLATGKPVVLRNSYAYADGGGATILQKVQADPGLALLENEDGTVTQVDTTPSLRWIGNGRTILNNKGKPVKRYEPYFSVTPDFEDARALVERGVTPLITYDSAGRPIRSDLPDGTFTKTVFDAWSQQSFDQNDTVLDSQWYKDRITDPVAAIATPAEVAAATKAAAHANTPSVTCLDSLGRSFLAISDNGPAGKQKITNNLDIQNILRSVIDAAGNTVAQFKTDMLGGPLYTTSMDSGEQWKIFEVTGKPLRNWDNKGNVFRYETDVLHRPLKVFLQQGNDPEVNTEKVIYGEMLPDAAQKNLRGRVWQHYDASAMAATLQADFKGNTLSSAVRFLGNYKDIADWNVLDDSALDTQVFGTTSSYDALNRSIRSTQPDGSILRPVYNETGVLDQVFISIKGMPETQFVRNIDYDAKGQRQSIVYGNNTATSYQYDPKTFRLTRLLTTGNNGADLLQQLQYTYDPVGNISFIKDLAQQDVVFDNATVRAENDYLYDAVYRLIQATGREQVGQNTINETATNNDFRDFPFQSGVGAGDMQALRSYTQKYTYDAAANITQLRHIAGDGSYTRTYAYQNNRLLSTTVGDNTTPYQYDVNGNMLNLPHLPTLTWDHQEQLRQIDLGGGGKAWYVYDATGQRVRKVIERLDGSREERIYLGNFERYRRTGSTGSIEEETETLHIRDDARRIALIETKTVGEGNTIAAASWQPLLRYQYGNHLGSAALELDGAGNRISYEEYHPYGTTSIAFTNKDIVAAAKRYRYIGVERDEESGLEYHGARYYLPWLGRWLSPDPSFLTDSLNVYQYTHNNPVRSVDPSGNETQTAEQLLETETSLIRDIFFTWDEAKIGRYLKDPDRKALFDIFIAFGEHSLGKKAKKATTLEKFAAGLNALGEELGLKNEFTNAALEGLDEARRLEDSRNHDLIANDYRVPQVVNAGTFDEHIIWVPYQGTTNGYIQAQRDAESRALLKPFLGFSFINSFGLDGAEPGGGGAREGRESAWGAPLKPEVNSGSRRNSSSYSPPPNPVGWTPTPKDGTSIIIQGSDPQGIHEFAERTGSVVKNKLIGSDLSEAQFITLKAHSDGTLVWLAELGKNAAGLSPEELGLHFIYEGFKGGVIRLILCNPCGGGTSSDQFGARLSNYLNAKGLPTSVISADHYVGLEGGAGPFRYGPPVGNSGLPVVVKQGIPVDAPLLPEDFHAPGKGVTIH